MGYGKITKAQAAIIGAYTGFTMGSFGDIQAYAEQVLSRPIFTHEFASQTLCDELREASKPDFLSICPE